jgi:hypothetical protein
MPISVARIIGLKMPTPGMRRNAKASHSRCQQKAGNGRKSAVAGLPADPRYRRVGDENSFAHTGLLVGSNMLRCGGRIQLIIVV